MLVSPKIIITLVSNSNKLWIYHASRNTPQCNCLLKWLYNSQRDGKSRTSIRFDFNSNGNNINEYISSSSFWNWINDISKRVKSYFFIFTI